MAVGTGKKSEIIELFLFRIRIHDLQLEPGLIIFCILPEAFSRRFPEFLRFPLILEMIRPGSKCMHTNP